jgi:hypothetical protein
MKYGNILEEELKNRVAKDFFKGFDAAPILGKIDFAVFPDTAGGGDSPLLWAEAKQRRTDILAMLTQLVLTIGKARTFDEIMPPRFLGCFDCEKIAFVPYSEIQDIFYQNDFNWNVAPSNPDTKEFRQVYENIKNIIENDVPFEAYLFYFEQDEADLKRFIRLNFHDYENGSTAKIRIDKNNFITIYNKWFETVKPTIQIENWDAAKRAGIIDGDFYLADLLSDDNKTLKDKLFVLLKSDHYELERKIDELGFNIFRTTGFSDNQKAHNLFWARYERPPLEIYWNYIIERRDLLVPQDVRERKGSFFTPGIWVEKSQEYLARVFGEDWQDEYYIWDCAAGTGNLLAGLTNKYKIWASTLDKQDVDVMRDRIKNGANLLDDHVFQFDFLNDSFDKLPEGLRKIISDEKLRKRLIVYINPPYAETNAKKGTQKGEKTGKVGLNLTKQREKYDEILGKGTRELFAQFMIRIYKEITGCKIAIFSKLKMLNAPFYLNFRNHFLAKLEKLYICPASTFDNVKGPFPIGFQIWDTEKKVKFKKISSDVFDKNGKFLQKKTFYSYENKKYINDWILKFRFKAPEYIGKIFCVGSDFQHQSYCRLNSQGISNQAGFTIINVCLKNIIECCVFFAVRKVIPATWLNDRDQFLYPNKKWENDLEFQNDCLAYTLFNNNISAKYGTNHWIPFREQEVEARTEFESHFMISFLSGKIVKNAYTDMFEQMEEENRKQSANWKEGEKRVFSAEAQAVFDAGREIWKYYHAQPNFPSFKNLESLKYNVNASYYDIRAHFKGVEADSKGKERMNSKSQDEHFNSLEKQLNKAIGALSEKIAPKVYKYGFLLD